ncbi:hypothetical protein Tco_1382420 [Tanacetum coccineum]
MASKSKKDQDTAYTNFTIKVDVGNNWTKTVEKVLNSVKGVTSFRMEDDGKCIGNMENVKPTCIEMVMEVAIVMATVITITTTVISKVVTEAITITATAITTILTHIPPMCHHIHLVAIHMLIMMGAALAASCDVVFHARISVLRNYFPSLFVFVYVLLKHLMMVSKECSG